MKKKIFLLFTGAIVLFTVFTTIQGKWDTYLMQGAAYYFQVKESLNKKEEAVIETSILKSEDANPELESAIEEKEYRQEQINIDYPDGTLNIVGLGDSLTRGIGSDDKIGYMGRLQSHFEALSIPIEVQNFAKNGKTSEATLKIVQSNDTQEALKNADLVFLTVGGNDIMNVVKKEMFSVTLEQIEEKREPFRENLNEIISNIHNLNPEADIVITGLYNPFLTWVSYIPEPFTALKTWNKEYISLASQSEKVHYIRVEHLFDESSEDSLYKDHFHPNDVGYEKISNEIISYFDIQKPIETEGINEKEELTED